MSDARLGFVLVALLLGSCTTTRGHESYMLQGSYEQMNRLVEAAHECGHRDAGVRYIGHGGFAVFIGVPPRPSNAFDCTTAWIRSHPEAGFSLP